MHLRTLIGQSCLVTSIVMLLNGGVTSEAAACSCLVPSVEASYNQSSDVVTADIRWQFVLGSTRYYVVRVQRTFKGCLEPGDRVLLKTHVDGATCGVELTGGTQLIQGTAAGTRFGMPVLSIGLCGYNVPVSELTEHDRAFLNGRTVCCGDDCTCADGSQPVQCFADPCSVAPECAEGTCVANYCGGCNAEFYDRVGYAVCQAEGECASNADCPDGEWCRQAAQSSREPIMECVPFVGEGQRCNGFTAPWLYEQCEPDLVCDTPDFVADAPGICRRGCSSDADCKAEEYCASDKTCDSDGACELASDCNLSGNTFPHPLCVGSAFCDDSNRCGWQCGEPAECQADSDCMRTGCSGQVCAAEPVVTTCEFRPEYACYQDPEIARCGCSSGTCGWAESEALQECLASANTVIN